MKIADNIVFKIANKALTPLVSMYLLLLVFMLPFDAYQFLEQPKDYISAHHIDITKADWRFQYLKPNGLLFLGALVALAIIMFGLGNRKSKNALVLRIITVFGIAGAMIYGFYQWYLTGFDH